MSEIVKQGWKKYLIALQLHPLRTKAITAGVLVGCSDVIAQKISGVKRLQFRRLLLLMLYGFAYSGPFGHFLHKLMDVIFQGKKGNKTVAKKVRLSKLCFFVVFIFRGATHMPTTTTVIRLQVRFEEDREYATVMAKNNTKLLKSTVSLLMNFQVLLEQLTTSPWNNFFFMMYYGLVVEGRPWGLVKNKVRKDYPSIQLTAWKFWPIVGWINYQYMPLQFRVLFHSFVASCWAIFLNLKARSITTKKT